MKIRLIDHTQNALELLLYTKNTRLQGGQSIGDIRNWPLEEKLKHLAYMRDTIKSSWEFVNYTFEISGVTRAFTHQLVRTRTGRYAQESMRTVDVSDAEVKQPIFSNPLDDAVWNSGVNNSMYAYKKLIEGGAPPQDARGILPTNVCTSIIAQFSLRTLHEMALVRLCTRTQGEYQDVFRAMKKVVVAIHPWADDFIQVNCVATGCCAFPRYTECPIQKYTFNGEATAGDANYIKRNIKKHFDNTRHEATPVVKDGRTM